MEKREIKKLLEQITDLYPHIKLSQDTAAIWAECLKDISYEKARNNLIEHIKQSKFPPTIADIRGSRKANSQQYCETTRSPYELYVPPDLN